MVQFAEGKTGEAIRGEIDRITRRQREFFSTGATKSIDFRLSQLKALKQGLIEYQSAILDALKADLNKSEVETYWSEIGIIKEIDYAIKHLRSWAKPTKVSVPLTLFPGRAEIRSEPLGLVLIIAPWNYPIQLAIAPLLGAIAAGNCALLKPSELAPHASHVLAEMIQKTFDPAYITVVEGGVEISQAVLEEKFDHIFFTGGAAIGKVVMAAAAKHLTPVTLELGGKSPCIVDVEVPVEQAAKRIAWGKFVNAGQTCIAPDYLLVHRQIKPALVEAIQNWTQKFYGEDPSQSPDYGRIISPKHFSRLANLLQDGNVLVGGKTDPADRYIAPTVLDQVSLDAPIMQEEIFGPILPIVEYEDLGEAIALINAKSKPLALYIFSKDKQVQDRILRETSAGCGCINDTILQVAVPTLPFGGVGESGIGSYHGKTSFDTFSHHRSVLYKPFWLDLDWRYAPYKGKLALLKRLIR